MRHRLRVGAPLAVAAMFAGLLACRSSGRETAGSTFDSQPSHDLPRHGPLCEMSQAQFIVYFRPEGRAVPDDAALQDQMRRWLDRQTSEPARGTLRSYVGRGLLELWVGPKQVGAALSVEQLRRAGARGEELQRYGRATHQVVITGWDLPRRRPCLGLWGAIAGSRAVAGALSGVILDPPRGRLLKVESHTRPLPGDLCLGDVKLKQSEGDAPQPAGRCSQPDPGPPRTENTSTTGL